MIFYFTGTGNSGWAAETLAKLLDDEVLCISDVMTSGKKFNFTLKDNEAVGFVFPIYAWGTPKPVADFIERAEFKNVKDNYVYSVVTCGGNIGNTMKHLKKQLSLKNLHLAYGSALVMPSNYIVGSDVEAEDIKNKKLKEADKSIIEISEDVKKRTKGVFKGDKGKVPFILSSIIHPLFIKGAADASKFTASDECTGCGLCQKVCTMCNIKVVDGKPVWGKDCCQCLACINYCPKKAINYGEGTKKRGRYVNPHFKR